MNTKAKVVEFQIGKNKLTPGFFENIKKALENRHLIKISMLKSSGRDRENIKQTAETIIQNMGNNYTCKIIGFTIILRKWRKAMR